MISGNTFLWVATTLEMPYSRRAANPDGDIKMAMAIPIYSRDLLSQVLSIDTNKQAINTWTNSKTCFEMDLIKSITR